MNKTELKWTELASSIRFSPITQLNCHFSSVELRRFAHTHLKSEISCDRVLYMHCTLFCAGSELAWTSSGHRAGRKFAITWIVNQSASRKTTTRRWFTTAPRRNRDNCATGTEGRDGQVAGSGWWSISETIWPTATARASAHLLGRTDGRTDGRQSHDAPCILMTSFRRRPFIGRRRYDETTTDESYPPRPAGRPVVLQAASLPVRDVCLPAPHSIAIIQ